MNKEGFLKFHGDCCDKLKQITLAKNADYTAGDQDPFFNFTQVEKMGIISAELGFLTRISDKFARITSFCKNDELLVKDESVQDTLLDMANYCIIMACYITHKQRIANGMALLPK